MGLELKELSVGYDRNLPILQDIGLRIEKGEAANFYGYNGIGKTTLLKTVATFIRPLKGQILYEGKPITNFRRRIFFLPETVDVPSRVTPIEYVRAVASLYGTRVDENRALKALKTVGVATPRVPLGKLSQGMKRRVQLSASLLVEAEIFVLDDPLVAVDEESKHELLQTILESLKEKGVVIMSSREKLPYCELNVDLKEFRR
ncbi:ABC transporter ATP-binding protein [Pyrococcus yayanosii]|uniref:Putative ABC transporter n=1 Tax=Pyrococcus yayanosii (strain CH1 / JCM 16557) TaxID=529709 RepID=F8AFB5_PYRYC|nr:ABC transporter ATP-binding protein [Pyrococcus yayanosii]AEH24948.1 putative ABC transporter [Pyrococcus yayanosii CH1]